jgi:pyridoxamine 5'-phosphate oxidase
MNGNGQPQPATVIFTRLRREYSQNGLLEPAARRDPLEQFTTWLNEAVDAQITEPNAMILATAGADGQPGARTVLLKDYDERGFVFFTNYESRKGHELQANPRASLLFLWKEIERQIRIDGMVEKVSIEESERYFRTRPTDARLGAWASAQSRPVPSRETLEAAFAAARAEYGGRDVPRPAYWGGYRLQPRQYEFWQGRPCRLHDRLLYLRAGDGWTLQRLAP